MSPKGRQGVEAKGVDSEIAHEDDSQGTASGVLRVGAPSLENLQAKLPTPDAGTARMMLETMLRIRHFDKLAVELSKSGESPGSVHPYVGQEAIAAGVCAALREEDFIASTHRGHGHSIARGADPYRMFAELLGKEDGYARGKGGSMHIADILGGNLGANGIAGGGVPIAVGAALASWALRSSKSVSVAFFGDGAANEGSVHEAINLASALRLPCVFVCENNLYSISVQIAKASAQPDIALRASGYGIEGFLVDGQDCAAVYAAASEAVASARAGKGPALIECKTYSYMGHSTFSQPKKPKDESNHWLQHDPIAIHTRRCISDGVVDQGQFEEIDREVNRELIESLTRARDASPARLTSMLEDVLASEERIQWHS